MGARFQRGHIFEAHKAFHVRYYDSEIIDGTVRRVQRSERLCSKDDKHFSTTCKAVKQKAAEVMNRINLARGAVSGPDIKVTEFWKTTYLPYLEKATKASTTHGYRKIWEQHLSNEFSRYTLGEYKTHHATKFLTNLADSGLGVRTIAHIRSLASGMFRHALRLGKIEINPWTDAGSLLPAKRPEGTHAYTLDEAEAISNALINDPPCQLVFCLATFLGLRPGEIAALQWDDISVDADGVAWVHVRRSAWRGIVGTTKTEESVASVPLIEPVRSMLDAWKVTSGATSVWMFPSPRGNRPLQTASIQKQIVRALGPRRIVWHGLYAGRRAAATLLVQLTGNAVASQYVLRHKNLATTTAYYVKPVRDAAVGGLQQVEDLLKQRKALAGTGSGDAAR
jgi:integrase